MSSGATYVKVTFTCVYIGKIFEILLLKNSEPEKFKCIWKFPGLMQNQDCESGIGWAQRRYQIYIFRENSGQWLRWTMLPWASCLEWSYKFASLNINIISFTFADFENRFRFHNGNELPPPEPFTGSNKSYPSRNPRNQGVYSSVG
jgi:hypothetical protein